MTVIEAVIQGIIQGVTEFLPVSGSGHLSIRQHFLGIQLPGDLFSGMLHLGTLIAVLILYRKTVWTLTKEVFKTINDIVHRRFRWQEMHESRRLLMMLLTGLAPLFLLLLPIPGTGIKMKDLSGVLAADHDVLVEGFAILATSTMLFLGIHSNRRMMRDKIVLDKTGMLTTTTGRKRLNVLDASLIGLSQFFAAMFPGLSRSGSALATGLTRGINKKTALDYSLVLGIPAILATVLASLKDVGSVQISALGIPQLVIGAAVSCVAGILGIKLLRWLVVSDKLGILAWYTLILGVLVLILGIVEKITKVGIFTGMPLA